MHTCRPQELFVRKTVQTIKIVVNALKKKKNCRLSDLLCYVWEDLGGPSYRYSVPHSDVLHVYITNKLNSWFLKNVRYIKINFKNVA